MIWINRYREKVLSECFNNDINNTLELLATPVLKLIFSRLI